MKKLNWVLFIIVCFVAAGCLDEKSEFTINPDGSGKVVYEVTIEPMSLRMMGEELAPEEQSRNTAQTILSGSSGVEAWADVSYELTGAGKTHFKGTAYFPDINKLDIQNSFSNFAMTRNEKNEIVIDLKTDEEEGGFGGDEEADVAAGELSEEELDQQIQQTRTEYNQSKMMMSALLSSLKTEAVLHLPGTIEEIGNFEKIDDRSARFSMSGTRMTQAMDAMMADDAFLRQQLRQGEDLSGPDFDNFEINEKIFGEKAPVHIVLAADTEPLFNYAAEMGTAKANYEQMISRLGFEPEKSGNGMDFFEFGGESEPAKAIEGFMEVEEEAAETVAAADPAAAAQAEAELEDNWNDFLHYTVIGRFELARSHAELIVGSQPDPTQLLALSEENQEGYRLLLKMHADSDELREISGKVLDLIEEGRYIRRTDPKIIAEEIRRLSTTIKGRIAATQRLKNAGEYAIPQMLAAIANPDRKNEMAYITEALPKIGRPAIRPLVAALQIQNVAVKVEVIRALGKIGYYEPLPYLKYEIETTDSETIRTQAASAIERIDNTASKIPAAELFFRLGENYYNQDDSLAAAAEYDFANVWFWNAEKQALIRQEVNKDYFDELMAMRACEWTLKADPAVGKAIGLWIAAFYRAESVGEPMPEYFGEGHADAMTYATTAGPEYLHQALERALKDEDAFVALGVVEAMAVNAGEKSLLHRLGTEQPLAKALSFADRKVRYSAAIAFAEANPVNEFVGSDLIVENLAEAVLGQDMDEIGAETAQTYAFRAVSAMHKLAMVRNKIVDLSTALSALIEVTQESAPQMRVLAAGVLAHLESPEAQQAIAAMAMDEANDNSVRIAAFESLALSAKINANLLLSERIEAIYELVGSTEADADLRAAAAGAYGALNLPSEQVKKLILDQSKS